MVQRMKLIVDIPDRTYEVISKGKITNENSFEIKLINMIKYGTPHPCPCDVCRYNPPSSADGKPCSMCVAEGRE